ncbi:hypothetical protein F5X99DRAFT_427784 [Biscogniauxia marginata]|nr:hypothetical protein F5X99DRAFT_427784 [Biscogniauxia marginata]
MGRGRRNNRRGRFNNGNNNRDSPRNLDRDDDYPMHGVDNLPFQAKRPTPDKQQHRGLRSRKPPNPFRGGGGGRGKPHAAPGQNVQWAYVPARQYQPHQHHQNRQHASNRGGRNQTRDHRHHHQQFRRHGGRHGRPRSSSSSSSSSTTSSVSTDDATPVSPAASLLGDATEDAEEATDDDDNTHHQAPRNQNPFYKPFPFGPSSSSTAAAAAAIRNPPHHHHNHHHHRHHHHRRKSQSQPLMINSGGGGRGRTNTTTTRFCTECRDVRRANLRFRDWAEAQVRRGIRRFARWSDDVGVGFGTADEMDWQPEPVVRVLILGGGEFSAGCNGVGGFGGGGGFSNSVSGSSEGEGGVGVAGARSGDGIRGVMRHHHHQQPQHQHQQYHQQQGRRGGFGVGPAGVGGITPGPGATTVPATGTSLGTNTSVPGAGMGGTGVATGAAPWGSGYDTTTHTMSATPWDPTSAWYPDGAEAGVTGNTTTTTLAGIDARVGTSLVAPGGGNGGGGYCEGESIITGRPGIESKSKAKERTFSSSVDHLLSSRVPVAESTSLARLLTVMLGRGEIEG